MKLTGITVNGIQIYFEHGHYLLKRGQVELRCDFGELNECIPEFEEYYTKMQSKNNLSVAV